MKGRLEKKIEEITRVKDVKLSTLKSNGIFPFQLCLIELVFQDVVEGNVFVTA